MKNPTSETQKVTVHLPRHLLVSARRSSGKGTTEVLRESLRDYVAKQAQMELLKLHGSYTPSIDLKDMRGWDE